MLFSNHNSPDGAGTNPRATKGKGKKKKKAAPRHPLSLITTPASEISHCLNGAVTTYKKVDVKGE